MQTMQAEAYSGGLVSTDIAPPAGLQLNFNQIVSSVEMRRFFEVREPLEWVDDAPMTLPSRGRIRVKVVAIRRLTFAAVGDEFGSDDD